MCMFDLDLCNECNDFVSSSQFHLVYRTKA